MAVVTDNHDGLSNVLKANFAVFRGSGYRICSERYSMTFWLLFNVSFEKLHSGRRGQRMFAFIRSAVKWYLRQILQFREQMDTVSLQK